MTVPQRRFVSFGCQGGEIRLVPFNKHTHFGDYMRGLNDPDVITWTLIGDFPFALRTFKLPA